MAMAVQPPSPIAPPEGQFRATFGRVGLHTQGHTVNNPLLFELMPENVLWINAEKAAALGIADGDEVEVAAEGVETERQLALLRRFECDEIQGYFFSRPLPAKEARQLLINGNEPLLRLRDQLAMDSSCL